MARWKPDKKIGKHELIGRRLFDEPMLIGYSEEQSFEGLDLRNFEEKRDDETSLDRLGRTGVEKGVKNYLLRRAIAASENFKPKRTFNGWFTVAAHFIEGEQINGKAISLIASPIIDEDLKENIYHAHVVKPDETDSIVMALYLRHLFTKYGKAHPVNNDNKLTLNTFTSKFLIVKNFINKINPFKSR